MPTDMNAHTRSMLRFGQDPRTSQRGVIALGVTLVMLIVMALSLTLFTPSLMLEQRTSAHQSRATAAFELAEAGVAWTIARLNDRTALHPASLGNCGASPAPDAKPFRDWYAPATVTPDGIDRDLVPPANTRVACSLADDGSMACSCPSPGTAPTVAMGAERVFDVTIEDDARDPHALRITATGCVHSGDGCSPATRRDGDASARISTLVKRLPRLASIPRTPLTMGAWLQVCDGVSVENLTMAGGGRLVHAGEAVQFGGGYQSSPLPTAAAPCVSSAAMGLTSSAGAAPTAMVDSGDPRLARLSADASALFQAFFGQSPARWADSACSISGTSASDRASNLLAAYRRARNPCRHFMIDGDIDIVGATLGAPATATRPAQPVVLASASSVRLGPGTQVHGMVHLNQRAGALVLAGARMEGAVIARGSLRVDGQGSIQFDVGILGAVAASGDFVRVPGAWIDE